MTSLVKQFNAVGDMWGISSVNKAVTNDTNKIFNFKFIINDATTVVYNGIFDFSKTIYSDRYTNKLNSIEQNSYISVTDMRLIVRDYPEITTLQLDIMFQQLLNICMTAMIKGITNLALYTFCVNLDGSVPAQLTIPAFPTNA